MATLPKQINKTLYIALCDYHAKNDSKIEEDSFSIFDCDMSKHGYMTLKTQTITIDLPEEVDLINHLLKNLEYKKNEKLKELDVIEEEIAKCQALPSPTNNDEMQKGYNYG